jgi:hypothetical protein
MAETDSERTPCEFYGCIYEPDHGWMVCQDCGNEYEED